MMPKRRSRGGSFLALFVIVVVLIVAGYGLYLANLGGYLPWQEDPTRIPVTAFADLPGTDADGTPGAAD